MGKKSLIKSTSKKAKAKDEETKTKTKKTAAKTTKSKKAKKTTAKKTVKTRAKSTAKKTAAKTRKTTKTAAKKPSLRQLLLKKFETAPVDKLFSPAATARAGSAPPLIDTADKEEAARLRQLLARSFSMQQLAEAAQKAEAEKKAAAEEAAKKAAEEAARKAAEEKAARQKAEAEKKAAEEAAAKKAAEEASRKAVEEEKAARQKAEAEKKAAEEAAAALKAAKQKDSPEVKVSYEKEAVVERKEKDPVENAIKIFIAGVAFLILLVVGASINNSGKYYIKEHDGAIEITKGKFAPLGEKHFITLPGIKAPETAKEVFSRKEVYPLIFGYYLEKADNLLQSQGLPDFEGIKAYLEKALAFATGNQMRSEVYRRIDNIDRIVLMYKAEVAMSKDTPESLEEALDCLQQAKTLAEDQDHKNLIANRIKRVEKRLAALKAKAEAEAAAAESEAQPEKTQPQAAAQ